MVDRLVRGTSWIWLLGVLLIGLVALNVSLLKLNAAAGRNAEWAKKLRVENADLQARVSRLGGGQQIQQAARNLGLVMPTADSVHYLKVNPAVDARRAAKRGSFVPMSSTGDLVSATPPPDPVVVAPPAPIVPTAGTTGVAGPTGTTGAATPAPAQATTTPATQPATGTTGAATP